MLYGSETWALPPTALKCLQGFQVEAARRFTGMLPKKLGATWVYPKSEEVMAAANLRPIGESILRRRSTILRTIEGRHSLEECRRAERRRGSPARQFWWEQEVALNVEEEGDVTAPLRLGTGTCRSGVAGHDVIRRRQLRELEEERGGGAL